MKRILLNILIVFIIIFSLMFIYLMSESYDYYSVYTKEELEEFFSWKDEILNNATTTLNFSFHQTLIAAVIIAFLDNVNVRNIFRIIITLIMLFIISFIYVMLNLTITF